MSEKLFKNVTKFLGNKKSRPILQGIHFSIDGNIYATNSHIAIMVKGFNKSNTDFVLNPKTLEQLPNEFPDMSRLFPDSCEHTLELDLELIKSLITSLKSYKKEQCKLVFSLNKLSITINNQEFYMIAPFKDSGEFTIHFSVEYLLIALQTFLDEKINATLLLQSSVRPVLLYSNEIKVIVTPIRVN